MLDMRHVLSGLLFVCWLPLAAMHVRDADANNASPYPMHDRVMCDRELGLAVRFPYAYRIPNQYHRGVRRTGGGPVAGIPGLDEGETDPEKIKEFLEKRRASSGFDIEVFTATADELPAAAALGHRAEQVCGISGFTWKEYDYYGDVEQRPHVDPKWAPEGITAVIGEGDGHCALALDVPGRELLAVLVVTGGMDQHRNQDVLASFEVMAEKRGDYRTWKAAQWESGKVILADGNSVSARRLGRVAGVDWRQAWEIETPNYHITTNVSPRHLVLFGQQMEALYQAYTDIYDPERVPPYKLELQVLKDQPDFAKAAASIGIGGLPPTVLGFFSPSQLSIFSYQGDDLFSTLAHEASHQFLHVTCNGSSHVPTWINEGLAVYFETSEFQRGRLVWKPPMRRLGQLKMYYGQLGQPVADLNWYIDHYGHIQAIQYAEVYAITHYWIFGSKKGRKKFKEYWLALKAGQNGSEAFEEIFMKDLLELQKFAGDRDKAVEAFSKILMMYVQKGYAEKSG